MKRNIILILSFILFVFFSNTGRAQTQLQDSAFSIIRKVLDHYGTKQVNSMKLVSYGYTDTSGISIEDSISYRFIFSKDKLYYGNKEIEFIKSDSFQVEVDHEDKLITVSKYKTQYTAKNLFLIDSVIFYGNQVNYIAENDSDYIISLNIPSFNCIDYKMTIDKSDFSLLRTDMLLYDGYDFDKKDFTGLYKIGVFYPEQVRLKNFPEGQFGVNRYLTTVNNQFRLNEKYASYQLKILN